MSIYEKSLDYYVYAFIREDGTPYYIGKGKGDRCYRKRKRGIKPPNSINRIVVMEKNLTELGALALERRLIRWYGRIDNNTGSLRNLTDGGDGVTNRIGYSHSESTKKKISSGNSGKRLSEESKRKISVSKKGKTLGIPKPEGFGEKVSRTLTGHKKSQEWIEKINNNPDKIRKTAEKHRGMKRSEEARERMSKAAKGRIPWNKGMKNGETRV